MTVSDWTEGPGHAPHPVPWGRLHGNKAVALLGILDAMRAPDEDEFCVKTSAIIFV